MSIVFILFLIIVGIIPSFYAFGGDYELTESKMLIISVWFISIPYYLYKHLRNNRTNFFPINIHD